MLGCCSGECRDFIVEFSRVWERASEEEEKEGRREGVEILENSWIGKLFDFVN